MQVVLSNNLQLIYNSSAIPCSNLVVCDKSCGSVEVFYNSLVPPGNMSLGCDGEGGHDDLTLGLLLDTYPQVSLINGQIRIMVHAG